MSNKIAVITDSTCNIPPEMIEQHHIYVVLQHLIWGTEDLLDLKDIDGKTFYERLTHDPVHPKTSQPPAPEFVTVIEEAKKDGAKEAVLLTVSAPLSGTHASALQAKEMVDIPVHVYDSRSAGMGLGWQVLAAAHARDSGADASGILAAAQKTRDHLAMVLMVDTLEFLHKGGRIGGARRLLGTALHIKPQLILNPETGQIETGTNTRTRRKAIEAMHQAFFKRMDVTKPLRIAVHHVAAAVEAEQVMNRIRDEYHPVEMFMNELTPVLGTHGGPGMLAICGYYDA